MEPWRGLCRLSYDQTPHFSFSRECESRSSTRTWASAALSAWFWTPLWSCVQLGTRSSSTPPSTTPLDASLRRCRVRLRLGVLPAASLSAEIGGCRADWVHVRGGWLPRSLFGRLHALLACARCLLAALAVLCSQRFDVVFLDQVSAPVALLRAFSRAQARSPARLSSCSVSAPCRCCFTATSLTSCWPRAPPACAPPTAPHWTRWRS